MATLTKRTRGGSLMFEIRFTVGKDRKTIPLGKKYTERTANEMLAVVEMLIHCQTNGIEFPGKKTVAWIEHASDELRQKLAKAGLIDVPDSHTLKELWDGFMVFKAKEVKESTLNLYGAARNRFFLSFKESENIEDLTKEQMQQWKNRLLDELAGPSVACYLKETKTVFNWGKAQGWFDKSPLEGIGIGSFVNKKNDRIVSMVDYRKMLDACHCQEWRVILALVRIGGLRCPSEVSELRWEDVNWDLNRFFVRSPKTEHHEGKEGRFVPLFPELRKELDTLFFNLESEGQEFVINRYRGAKVNLRTPLGKIVRRAGLEMFPRPFDNMRMTRSNEVYNQWGAFKETQWIGHSSRTRTDHYLMVTDDDFTQAAQLGEIVREPEKVVENNTPKVFPPLFPPVLK